MEKSIIKDIFYGKRGNSETIKVSKEYWDRINETSEISKNIEENLTEKQKELFKKLEFAEMGIEAAAALTYFAEGFKIGLRIGIECMED